MTAPGLDLDALADVLRRTDQLEPVDVALGIGGAGVEVLPTAPGGKDPLLTKLHIDGKDRDGNQVSEPCDSCRAAGLRPAADHGATRDPDVIRRLWSSHDDTGVGMKNHPQLVRGDGDHADADALKKYRRESRSPGEGWPYEAPTPGGQYRRRYMHSVADGADLAGGGTTALGVSWYQSSGYVIVKGAHPNGKPYPPFKGDVITPLPATVRAALEAKPRTDTGPGERAASSAAVRDFHTANVSMGRPHLLRERVRRVERAPDGERHRTAATELCGAYSDAVAGFYPSATATLQIRNALKVAGWDDTRLGAEFDQLEAWAVAQVLAKPAWEVKREAESRLRQAELKQLVEEPEPTEYVADLTVDEIDALRHVLTSQLVTGTGTDDDDDGDPLDHPRISRGGSFVYDVPDKAPSIWGTGDEILWAQGEGLLVAGPTGVGKSTLVAQLVAGRLGLIDQLLGFDITESDRSVLYLAMDRPTQIRRLLHRLFANYDARSVLDERLIVWSGPLPATLNSDPSVLVRLAGRLGVGTVIVDSLKDAAVKLTDDESGGNINRAFQLVTAEGIDLAVSHHQRKSPADAAKAPKSLDDIYGSALVPAGMGSVAVLWGKAGDAVVELHHLKQPLEQVPQMRIEHDNQTGLSSVVGKFDPLQFLKNRPRGATAKECAVQMFEKQTPTKNEIAKAKRQLDRLARTMPDRVTRTAPDAGGDGGQQPARWSYSDDPSDAPGAATGAATQGGRR